MRVIESRDIILLELRDISTLVSLDISFDFVLGRGAGSIE